MVRWIGHAGLASHRPGGAPDREALQDAVRVAPDVLELDVLRAGDGALVLLHDVHAPAGRAATECPVTDLRALHPGLLTLDEAVEHLAGALPLLLDLKGAGCADAVVRWARGRRDLDGLAACTDDLSELLVLRYGAPGLARWRTLPETHADTPGERRRRALAVATRDLLPSRLPLLVREVAAAGICCDRLALTRRLGDAARRARVHLAAWTVNTPRGVASAVARGADHITSDRVALLRP